MAGKPDIVAIDTTLDGVTVYMYADGSISNGVEFVKGRLAEKWRSPAWARVHQHYWHELPAFLRAVRKRELLWQKTPFTIERT